MRLARDVAAVAFGLVLFAPLVAKADGGGEVAATALFDEARHLMAEHRYSDACPKLAESERLAPSGGTLLNLADCYEHTGQTASAWAAWKEVAARANAAGKSQIEKMALDRADALERKLDHLTIALTADSDVPGVEIKRDGLVVGQAEYGVAIPVDPGAHLVEVSAPKKKPWSAQVDVGAQEPDAHITVTLVDDERIAPTPVVATPETVPPSAGEQTATGGNPQLVVGWLTVGIGVAGVVVGSIFGLNAASENRQATEPSNCPTSTQCITHEGVSLTDQARSDATVSTIFFALGGAALAGGAVLILTAPAGKRVQIAPAVGQAYAGALVTGTF